MGSRLEKNSTLVRKRIEGHTFNDEQGEEYESSTFGGFSDYMRRKKIKLQNLDAEIRANSADKPPIFRGVVVHVNGYTQPSLSDIHNLVVSHGGGFLQYLDGKTAVTHVIASHLTPKKTVEFGKYRIVKPAWVVDSVKAGRMLPWDAYRLVDEGVTQKVIGFDNGQIVSQPGTQRSGYRDQSDTSWYTSQLRQSEHELERKRTAGAASAVHIQQKLDDANDGQKPSTDNVLSVDIITEDTLGGGADLQQISAPSEHGKLQLAETVESVNADRRSRDTPQIETRILTAEEHNANLLSDPHLAKSSTANPDFINQYYRESRLHHLSTWKADLKAQMLARAQEKSQLPAAKTRRPPGSRRYIMHIDFDCFFAAVSLRKHPDLIGKPVVVAHGSGPGSEIASCNYSARKYGVKNGMWMKSALGLCPDLKVLPYDYPAYEEASRHFYDCILHVDGPVRSISIDEALLDISEQCIQAGGSDGKGMSEGSLYREQEHAQNIATQLRASVKEKTGCDVSVGIGGNILLAKVALRKAKPAGQHLIKPDDVLGFVGELSVTDLPGVAWSIGNKLEEIGIKFVKDVRSFNKDKLISALGPKTGEKIWDYSRGIDRQEVDDQVVRKSVSAEINWGIRFINQQQAEDFVQSLSDELSRRLLEQVMKGKQLTMKIMRKAADAGLDPPKNLGHGKCDTFNKSILLGVATNDGAVIGKEAISILRSYNFPPGELRGLGVQMQKLEPLKPSPSKGGFMDASQRRLQFKKPDVQIQQPPTPSRLPHVPSSRTPRLKDTADLIEDVPTPEKAKASAIIPGAADFNLTMTDDMLAGKPLNVGGTQFILPSQIDPTVLAELPADIRNKLAPKQKSILDIVTKPARPPSPSNAPLSRSVSPYPGDKEATLPDESQLDPEILAALPPDVREEVLAQYKRQDRKHGQPTYQGVLPRSPLKSRALAPSKKLVVTPTKKQKTASLFGKSRAKRAGNSVSTLTQSNFISMPKPKPGRPQQDDYVSEEISESFLNELPEDIRSEILAEQKRNRMKAKSGLNFDAKRRKARTAAHVDVNARGQQKLQLPKPPDKPTFTSQRLSSLPELRDAVSAWVREYSADGDGPDEDDVAALSDYLCKVVLVERDMAKATSIVNWLGLVIEYERFGVESTRLAWENALDTLKNNVQRAVVDRGLARVVFDC